LLALGLMVALIVPLVSMLKDKPLPVLGNEQSLSEALREACSHSGFWLLAFGFFVCGFQVVFIGVHLPAYLIDQHLPATVGTTVLALIGLFNVFGTYTAGGRMSKPRLLTGLYLLRAVVIALFLWAPVTTTTAYLFGMAIGFLWLSTVPLTNGTVATLFGVRNLSMLGGIVFLFHQLGSFLGGWLGGVVYDRTGSYDLIWQVSILLSLLAAALNWPVREQPVARLQTRMSAV
jgi:predicted MFS family arabinose efflux permease